METFSNDLITLEQLKEQKKLLRSIRLRKEELKALDGRRKALEALNKMAMESERKLDQVYEEPADQESLNESKMMQSLKSQMNEDAEKRQQMLDFDKFLNMLKEKQVLKLSQIKKK